MICVFITAFRVKSEDWSAWRSHIAGLFEQRTAHADWDLHIGQHEETLIDPSRRASDPVGAYLGALRGHDIYRRVISGRELEGLPMESQLVILRGGEIALVEVVNLETQEAGRCMRYRDAYFEARPQLFSTLASAFAVFRPRGAPLEKYLEFEKNATQMLIAYDPGSKNDLAEVEATFACEGLSFAERRAAGEPSDFTAGWSFSALASLDPRQIGLFAALMVRLQAFWYHQRVMRDRCIEDAATFTSEADIKTKVETGHGLVQRQFEYTVWAHEMREFAANLKPFLKLGHDAVAKQWELDAEALYIEKSMTKAHELITSGYQSRILLQERRQSSLLFIIAAVGLLGMVGSVVSMMTLLTWGGLLDIASLQTTGGRTAIYAGLAFTFAVFFIVLGYFAKDRLGKR